MALYAKRWTAYDQDAGRYYEAVKWQYVAEGLSDVAPNRPHSFDVFLSYNSKDEGEVREVAKELRRLGLRPWLDKDEIRPGDDVPGGLNEALELDAAAIFVGANGEGPWQRVEIETLLEARADRATRVIPVFLGTAPPSAPSKLPPKLRDVRWVDFREPESDPVEALYFGLTGSHLPQPA